MIRAKKYCSVLQRLALVFLLMTLAAACDSFVEETELPIDSIGDEQLDSETQIPFLIKGVQARFATTYGQAALLSGGLSDEMVFDRRAGTATFPEFEEIENGQISFSNASVSQLFEGLGELRFFSDNLIERLEKITIEDADLEKEAQFTGLFYGGLARYFYATYFGLGPTEGGGVISPDPDNPAPFIPSAEMYALASEKLAAALTLADAYHARVIHTVLANIELFLGNYSGAEDAAAKGLQNGDLPFTSLYTSESVNHFFGEAGNGRLQWVVDARFNEYVENDSDESTRIPLVPTEGQDGTTFYQQDLYPDPSSELPLATWQENELILAELSMRGGNAVDARMRIDGIRASHGIDSVDGQVTIDTIVSERERELFTMGKRLVDQRRFDLWHLEPGTWQYLPITQTERSQNPNF